MSSRRDIKVIIIGGSAGSYNVVRSILSSIPADFHLPVVMCLHRLRDVRSGFAESLNISSNLPVREAQDKDELQPGVVYLSPANYHLYIERDMSIALSTHEEIHYSRPSIDLTFETAGFSLGGAMAGILLSGTNRDGSKGLYSAYRRGAFTVVQDPGNAQFGIMPAEALTYFKPHLILTDTEISEFVNSLKDNVYA
ncbi:MAG TPA: chemotaxis protein CheB [Bacteroidales bacterium]|nr:chemotaxis protein CheB [Bacteroidales bacterium]